jgi:cytochrome c oxidase subunit III
MANDTTIEDVKHHDHAHGTDENLWEGGQSPFNSSYGKIMMWYFLLSDAFTFAGFLIAYGALRFSVNAWPVPDFVFSTAPFGIHNAPLIFVTFMTFVLIVSSVTVLRAVQEGKHENERGVIKWLVLTVFGGAIFLGSQAWEWTNLISVEGVTVYNNPFSVHQEKGTYITLDEVLKTLPAGTKIDSLDMHGSKVAYVESGGQKYFEKVDHYGKNFAKESPAFESGSSYLVTYHGDYMPGAYKNEAGQVKVEPMGPGAFGALFFFITGFHGFHVFSGLVFLLIIALNTWSGFYKERHNGHEMVEKVGLYWHFVDLVWVFVFLVFYLI